MISSNNNENVVSSNNNENVVSSNNNEKAVSSNENNNQVTNNNNLKVNTATFYLDGNPNTGITTTINVGKEHSGERIEGMTTFSRDGSKMNNPEYYEDCIVDDEGNIVITEYAAIPKYPDYCLIELRYGGQEYKYGCAMGKHKGSQTVVPKIV